MAKVSHRRPRGRERVRAPALTSLLAAALACAGCGSQADREALGVSPGSLAAARERVISWLAGQPDLAPGALLTLEPLRIWFDLPLYPDLDQRYRAAIRNGNSPDLPAERKSPDLRILGRLMFATELYAEGRSWEQIMPYMFEAFERGEMLGINVLNIPALYCDQVPYPTDYMVTLRRGVDMGGYFVTHVALAAMWMRENGCDLPYSQAFFEEMVAVVATIPDGDDQVFDLEIEATALLPYLGHRELVNFAFVKAMLSAQREDGGWSLNSADTSMSSNWHPSVLALWVILSLEHPTVTQTPMVVQPPPGEGGGS